MKKFSLGLFIYVSIICSSFSYAITAEETALPRLIALSEIPTAASIAEVIALGSEGSTNELRQQFVFTALTRIGPSVAGDNYAKTVLDTGTAGPHSIRGALGYLAEHSAACMVPYVETYSGQVFPYQLTSYFMQHLLLP